ncbi:hypothetical protein GCM10010517_04480 [Streptosporangium fragile]|uniref:MOSC domain-containing protein n=1 Tax=Streptosporangium fragile TaxID=46186 RepID=A0ABN3VQ69_9ACTN
MSPLIRVGETRFLLAASDEPVPRPAPDRWNDRVRLTLGEGEISGCVSGTESREWFCGSVEVARFHGVEEGAPFARGEGEGRAGGVLAVAYGDDSGKALGDLDAVPPLPPLRELFFRAAPRKVKAGQVCCFRRRQLNCGHPVGQAFVREIPRH